MLAFSIIAPSLELVNSGVIFPADSSVLTTGSPSQRVSVPLCSGVKVSEPPPHTLLLLEFPGWTRTGPDKGSPAKI
jgi:hypothetical protein